jgi:hypothetical protein
MAGVWRASAELERRVAADGAKSPGRVFGRTSRMAGKKKGEYLFAAGEERMTGLRWGRWAETRMTQAINQVDGQDGGTLLRAALGPGGGRYGRVWEYDGRACKTEKRACTGWYFATWGGSAPGAAVWPAVEVAPMYSAAHCGESTRLL